MSLDQATIAAYEAARKLAGKPFRSACYAPYTSLYFNTNGDVIACCKNTTYVLGNVASQGLDDIWRGNKAQAMRKAVKDYKLGVGCEFCEWQIKGGAYDQVYATIFDDLPVRGEHAEWPARMEFTVSNTCNLACVMCYGILSSTIRAHREKLPPLPKVYDDRFFADLRKYLPHLVDAKFFGGEPFLAQENYRIWDMMIADGITIPCHVTTNGTQWSKRVERVIEALPCSISVSVDGATKQTVESVRVNAVFEEVLANVDRFLAYTRRRGTTLSLTYCLMRQNWHEFGDYLRYAEERGVDVFINTVIDPVDCSLYSLPAEELKQIVARMEEQDRRQGYSRLARNGNVWRSGIAALLKNADERQRELIAEIKDVAGHKKPLTAAWKLAHEGKSEEALRVVAKIDKTHQDYYARLSLEGHLLRLMQRFDEAEKVLDEAITLWGKSPNAIIERAWMRLQQGRFADGLADADRAVACLADQPGHVLTGPAYAVRSNALLHLGRMDEAAHDAQHAVALGPTDTYMHLQLAWVFYTASRFAEAKVACDRALELKADNTDALRLRDLLAKAAV